MKTFQYTARDKTGALQNGAVTAKDRAEALGKLKAQQLVPVSVTEGARAPVGTAWRFDAVLIRRTAVFAVALVAVATAVLVGVSLLRKRQPDTETTKPAARAAVAAPAVSNSVPAQPPAAAPEPTIVTAESEAPPPQALPVVAPERERGIAAPRPAPPVLMVDMRPGKTNTPPDGLTSGTERILNTMFTARLGGPPPPLLYFPPNEVTNLVAVLSRNIGVFDDDDEATLIKKENLAIIKQKLKEFLNEGGRPEDFMVFYRDILQEAYEERTEMQQAYNALRAAGEEEAAAEYLAEANKALLEKGSMPLTTPPRRRPRQE
jgi:hypothetical protein